MPALASRIERLPGNEFRLELRSGATFSDGTSVTEADVIRSLEPAGLRVDSGARGHRRQLAGKGDAGGSAAAADSHLPANRGNRRGQRAVRARFSQRDGCSSSPAGGPRSGGSTGCTLRHTRARATRSRIRSRVTQTRSWISSRVGLSSSAVYLRCRRSADPVTAPMRSCSMRRSDGRSAVGSRRSSPPSASASSLMVPTNARKKAMLTRNPPSPAPLSAS